MMFSETSTKKFGFQVCRALGVAYSTSEIKEDLINANPSFETFLCSKCESSFEGIKIASYLAFLTKELSMKFIHESSSISEI